MPRYCIDTDTFIRAKNGEYAMNVHIKFWNWIDDQVRAGNLFSSSLVYKEITDGNDELTKWAKERHKTGHFVEPSQAVQAKFGEIANYVNSNYGQSHANLFLSKADAWVIAHAFEEEAAVVTHEKLEENSKRVKIPNVCRHFTVSWCNIYKVQQDLNAKF